MIWSAAQLRTCRAVPVEPAEIVYAFVSLEGEPSANDEALLDEKELSRSRRFVRPIDRRRYVLAHAALRALLARCLGVEVAEVRYESGIYGKPRLASGLLPFDFNLSHSEGLALLAVARQRSVGVDIERLRDMPDALNMADLHFSAAERRDLQSLPRSERPAAFLRCWTRKEAIVKATGEGLRRALDDFDVDLAPGSMSSLTRYEGRPGAEAGWSLRDLPSPPGYVAAGAVSVGQGILPQWRELSSDEVGVVEAGG